VSAPGAPVIRVDINFSGSTWTNVSAYVLVGTDEVTWRRGRSSPSGVAAPGEASFVLRNEDGRFTPGNTSGAYTPNIRKRVGVRIFLDGSRVWTGFVDNWRPVLRGGVEAVCEVQCSDRLRLLESTRFQSMGVEEAAHVANANGGACWPMVDFDATQGDQWAAWRNTSATDISILGGFLGGKPGSHDFVEDAPPFMRGSIQLTRDDGLGPVLQSPITFDPASGGAVSMWFKTPFNGFRLIDMDRQGVNTAEMTLTLNGAGALVLSVTNDSGNTHTLTRSTSPVTGTQFADDVWHHVIAGVDTNGTTLRMVVDGSSYISTAGSARTIASGSRRMTIGGSWDFTTGDPTATGQVNLAAVTVIPGYMPTATERTAFYNAGANGFHNIDTVAQRRTRFLKYLGNPYTITLSDGTSGLNVGGQETAGKSLVDLVNEIAHFEPGVFYVDHLGELQYRGAGYAAAGVLYVVSATDDIHGSDLVLEAADRDYFNTLEVNGPAGSVYRENTSLVTQDGSVSESRTGVVAPTKALLGTYADRVLTWATAEGLEARTIPMDLMTSPVLGVFRTALAQAPLLAKVSLTDLPSAVYGFTSLTGYVQSITVTASATRLDVSVEMSAV